MTSLRTCLLLVTMLLTSWGSGVAAAVADPLTKTDTFTPVVTFSELHTEKVVAKTNPVSYEVAVSRSCTATVVANIAGIVLADIDGSTAFSLTLGGMSKSFTLGQIPTYAKGQTTAFYCWNGWDGAKKPLGTGGIKLVWTAAKLTVTVTMTNETARPGPIGTDAFVGMVTDTGAAITIKDTLTADVSFGPVTTSVSRTLYVTGRSSVTHVRSGPVSAPVYEFDLNTVSEAGGAEYTLPVVALTSPKQGSTAGPAVTLTGTAADGYGLTGVEWTQDLTSPWTETPDFSYTATPADGLWGATSATWLVDLTNLPHGTDKVWVRAVDASGNASKPLLVSLVNPLPLVLTGRWDGLLVPSATADGVRGAITFTMAVNGAYSGSLVLEEGTYPISGTLAPDETMTFSVTRKTVPVTKLDIKASIGSFSPAGETTASISGTVKLGATGLATFNAFRSPWSKTKLAAGNLAGRFHMQIAAAASPIGNSFAVVTTVQAGAATAAFTMGDGSVVTWSGVLGAGGQLPAFARLYGKGSVSGLLTVDGGTRTILPATIQWVRPAAFADKQFPSGFNYTLAASGQVYAAPIPATARVMGLGAVSPNATAKWSGDGVAPEISQGVLVNIGNTVTVTGSADSLKLAVTGATGLWTGSFKIPGTAVLSACKLLIVGNQAYGFWTAPAPTGSVLKRYGIIQIN